MLGVPRLRYSIILTVISWGVALGGCSPDMFSSDNLDRAVIQSTNYHLVNEACGGLDLSKPLLDVTGYRKILNCFNANGVLDPIVKINDKLKDDELSPWVDFWNETILGDRRMIAELKASYETLSSQGILDETLMQFGRLIENDAFVVAILSILRRTSFDSFEVQKSPHLDPMLLRAIEIISEKMTPETVSALLDFGLSTATARVFEETQRKFRGPSPAGRTIEEISASLFTTLRRDEVRTLIRTTLLSVADGSAYEVLDRIIPVSGIGSEQGDSIFLSSVAGIAKLGAEFFRSQPSTIAYRMGALFNAMDGPVRCMRGAATIPNARDWAVEEIATHLDPARSDLYFGRDLKALLMFMKPLCEYPNALPTFFPALEALTDQAIAHEATRVIQAAYAVIRDDRRPVLEALLLAMEEMGRPSGDGLVPMLGPLAELTDRGVWSDLVLLLELPNNEARSNILSSAIFFTRPHSSLGGKSILDVYMNTLSRVSREEIVELIKSLAPFIESDEPMIVPGLGALRKALLVNDVHPVITIFKKLMASSSRLEQLHNTIFKMIQMPEFRDSIKLVSSMAKDGRLERLMGSVLTLFQKFSEGANGEPIHELVVPPFVAENRHDFISKDLPASPGGMGPAPLALDACRNLSLHRSIADRWDPMQPEQALHFAGCIGTLGEHEGLENAFRFLLSKKTLDGRTYFQFGVDLISELGARLTIEELIDLKTRWLASMEDGSLEDMLEVARIFVSKPVRADGETSEGTALEPIIRLIAHAFPANLVSIEKAGEFVATILKRLDFPSLLRFARGLWSNNELAPDERVPDSFDLERIMRWVHNKECDYDPKKELRNIENEAARAQEILEDYDLAVNGWELFDGEARKSWDLATFFKRIDPMLTKLGDPAESHPERSAASSILNIIRYFGLRPGETVSESKHYPPEYLAQWFHERSMDGKLFAYFYPGEKKPRARILSTLDILELVVINADLVFQSNLGPIPIKMPDNQGYFFLALVGDAWGDEEMEAWPEPIREKFSKCPQNPSRRKYDGKRCPLTLYGAYQVVMSTLKLFQNAAGIPDLPGCPQIADPSDDLETRLSETAEPRVSLGLPDSLVDPSIKAMIYNNAVIAKALENNLPDTKEFPNPHPQAGGIKVLRDMFYQMYWSSPEEFRNPRSGWSNNLNVILTLVRMGMGRQIGRFLKNIDLDDPSVHDVFYAVLAAAESPFAEKIIEELLTKDSSHRLFWKIFEELFKVLEQPGVEQLRSTVFYGLASIGQMGRSLSKDEFDPIASRLAEVIFLIIRDHRDLVIRAAKHIGDLSKAENLGEAIRAYYRDDSSLIKLQVAGIVRDALDVERGPILPLLDIVSNILSDAESIRDFDLAWNRLDTLSKDAEIQSLGQIGAIENLLNFFEEEPLSPYLQTATRVRFFLASQLVAQPMQPGTSGVGQLLTLIARDPLQFQQMLESLGEEIEQGNMGELLELMERSIR